eukprot:CAMPEP_0176385068 /NCGR_PEP_ID=MMETSP0126-20121128/34831_1 /TAXON_ID=141414 ORGANISM="Strombidinopsis acuminatum, Strain SPMC142" /NCGR_SAMPLE_ID=MMETSP0126 /ASSEMBLY_ACC=CAM_ASM_000229 /LENGTH=107 /DNA_ID=CAMNT_0017751161 /DNA_START=745 /DNA_END=1068 /DNA_ORIENTATION=+
MYPVLLGSGSVSNKLDEGQGKPLGIEFNCMGIDTTQQIDIVIPLKQYAPVELSITKQCGGPALITAFEEELSQSPIFSIFMYGLTVVFFIGLGCCFYNAIYLYDHYP